MESNPLPRAAPRRELAHREPPRISDIQRPFRACLDRETTKKTMTLAAEATPRRGEDGRPRTKWMRSQGPLGKKS